MIRKRSKTVRITELLDHLCDADKALCKAALTGVLTPRQDQRLRDLIHVLRVFTDNVEAARPAPEDGPR